MMRRVWASARTALCLCVCAFATGSAVEADEYYFAIIFGSQTHPKMLRDTHSWATFVRAVGEGPDFSQYQLYVHTLSWMPRRIKVRVWSLIPEPGVNLSLEETLRTVYAANENVTLWGPFVISQVVYERSIEAYQKFMSGQMVYRAIDTLRESPISDCIHAVAEVDPQFGREHYPLIRVGVPASRYIARQIMMHGGYDQWLSDNAWLLPRLGPGPAGRHTTRYRPARAARSGRAPRGAATCLSRRGSSTRAASARKTRPTRDQATVRATRG